ncbi:MAG: MBL fold metallo-hydrolase [Bacilli bacterium]|nr:MBL fold metallo-hydrolase [Bacilli bacterium]
MEIKVCGSIAPYPKDHSNCSGFLITEDDFKVLLDCGPGSTSQLDAYRDLRKLAVIISHYHPDHYSDIFALANASFVNHKLGFVDELVSVYLPKTDIYRKTISGVDENGWGTCKYVDTPIEDYEFIKRTKHEHFMKFIDYHDESRFDFGSMHVSFKRTKHPITTYSTKIESPNGTIVYSSDTGYVGNNLETFAKDADILICESSFLRGQVRSEDYHLYAHEAGKIASKAGVKNLILFHTWPEISKEEYIKEAKCYFPNTFSANEGEIITLEDKKILRKENKEEIK